MRDHEGDVLDSDAAPFHLEYLDTLCTHTAAASTCPHCCMFALDVCVRDVTYMYLYGYMCVRCVCVYVCMHASIVTDLRPAPNAITHSC